MRHGQAERLGGLEVDHHLEFGRGLHRQVSGPLALKNAIHVASGLPVWLKRLWAVADQATLSSEEAEWIGCWQSMSGCERDDQTAIIKCQRNCHRDQAAIRSACKFSDGALNIISILPTEWAHLHSKQPRSGLDRSELADT